MWSYLPVISRARLASALLALTFLTPAAARSQLTDRADTAVVARIRDEGFNRSQVMETASWLTDVYGPRLTSMA